MPIKSVKMKILKNKKICFFSHVPGSLNPKITFLGQKVWPVARARADGQTDRQSDYWGHPFRVSGFFPSTYHQGSAQQATFRPGFPFLSLSDKWVIFCRFFVVVRRVFFAFVALSLFVAFAKVLSLFGKKRLFCRFFYFYKWRISYIYSIGITFMFIYYVLC